MFHKPIILKYKTYLYGTNKILKKPLEIVTIGNNVYLDEKKAILAKSIYPGDKADKIGFSKLNVLYGFETIDKKANIKLPSIKRVEYIDTMYIEKEVTLKKLQSKISCRIISYYFEVAQTKDYFVFAQSYVPDKQKFTQIVALPINNIIKMETYNAL